MIKGEITKKLTLVLLIIATTLTPKVFAATDTANSVYISATQTDFSVNDDIKFSINSSEDFINELNSETLAVESTKSVEYIDTGSGVQLPPPPVVSTKPDIFVETPKGQKLDIVQVYTDKLSDGTQNNLTNSLIYIPKEELTVPGTYSIKIVSEGETISKDFTWGILALNSNKSLYTLGDTAKLSMAVLDELGNMDCEADLTLTISKDFKQLAKLTTKNGIKVNKECKLHGFTLVPDYEAVFKPQSIGEYSLTLKATTKNSDHTIHDSFRVERLPDFDIERLTATRLYPVELYPVELKITANKDFTGKVIDQAPSSFNIQPNAKTTNFDSVQMEEEIQRLIWDVSLKKGDTVTLGYSFNPPDISPEIYLLGKLELVNETNYAEFSETRYWQLANDAVGSADASRVYTTGFELNSTTAGMEYDENINSPAISNSTYRSGSYALNTALGADSTEGIGIQFASSDSGNAFAIRTYLRIATLPAATEEIVQILNTSNTVHLSIRMTSSGALQLYSNTDTAQVGSDSTALSTNTWYRVEMLVDSNGTGTSKMALSIDGVEVSGTRITNGSIGGVAGSVAKVRIGILTSGQADLYWDDIAVNQDGYTNADNYPGEGKIVYLRPNGNGTLTECGTGDYSNLDETPPNDAAGSDYVICEDANDDETYTLTDSGTAGIGANDYIKLLEAWSRHAGSSVNSGSRTHQMTFKSGATLDANTAIPVNSTSWYTNDDGTPRNADHTIYDAVGTANYGPITIAELDALEITITTPDATPDVFFTALWVMVEYVPAEGGRLFSSGFELQSTTAGVEWSAVTGTLAINTSAERSGLAALEVASLASTTEESVAYHYVASGSNTIGPIFYRAYLYITTAPSAANRIIEVKNDAGTSIAFITLDNSRLLRLYDEVGLVQSASAALATTTWYRIELKVEGSGGSDTVEAKIDGATFATTTASNLSSGTRTFLVGGNMNGEANTTGSWLFDDIAINQNAGSTQNSYPGHGRIAHLKPNADGTATAWSGAYSTNDEITPNDATGSDYIFTSAENALETHNLEDSSTYSIPTSATITLASTGIRFLNATAVSATVVRVCGDSSCLSKIESDKLATSANTWYTNQTADPMTPPLTLYSETSETTALTTTALDALQLGVRLEVDGGTNAFNVSTLWMLIEYNDSISISGTCDAFDQTTDCGDTGTVRYAVNGTLQFASQETIAGTWTISGIVAPNTNDIITTFIDGAGDTDEAVNISKYDGSDSITGVTLFKEHLVVGSADDQTLTNTNLGIYDNSVSSDEDIFHDVNSGALTVDSTAQSSTEELYIDSGDTYQPGGTVATHDIEIDGTFTAEANAITVSGSWNNDSNFTSTGTVTFTATSGTESIDSTGSSTNSFSALTLGSGSGTATWSMGSALDVNGALNITYGTLGQNGTHNITTAGDVTIGSSGVYTKSTGTWTFDGTTATTLTNSGTQDNLGSVTLNKTDAVDPTNNNKLTAGSGLKMDTLTIDGTSGQADTFYLGASGHVLDLVNVGSTATVLTVNGTLSPGDSTVKYSATNSGGDVNVTTTTYDNIQFGGAETYVLTGNLTGANQVGGTMGINNTATLDATTTPYNMTIAVSFNLNSGGTFLARGSTVRITNNYTNAGTLTAGTSTFILTATSSSKSINSTGAASAAFYNLTLGESSGTATWSMASALDVDNALNITYGTLAQNGSNNITTAGNVTIGASGNYTKSTGTWTFAGTTAATLTNTSTADNLGIVVLNKTDTVSPSTNNKLTTTTETLYDTLTINGTGGQADTFVAGDAIYLLSAGSTANVLVVDGTIDLQTNNVTVFFEASNSGGNINVPTIPYHSISFEGDTFDLTGDLTGANDVEGDITINGATLDVTTAPYDIALNGSWSNNNVFVPRTGDFYIVGSGTSAINGSTTCNNFISTAAGKTINFQKHTANTPYFIFENDFTMTGTLGNEITIQSDTNGSQWLAKFDTPMSGSTYVDVKDSGCYTASSTISFDSTSNNISGNDLTCWLFGSLTTDIVDAGGSPVTSPSVAMTTKAYQFLYQTSTATLGTSTEKIRVTNSTASPTWNLTLAASTAPTDFWDGSTADYDFNDPTASAGDGGDADSLGGQLSVNPTAGSVTPEGGCSSTGITKGSSTAFNQGTTDEITLLTAGGSADVSCYWDFIGIALSQTIPAQQNATSYDIDMTLTIL